MVDTYIASAMSISGTPFAGLSVLAGRSDRVAKLCVQRAAITELAWQHTGASTLATLQLLPLQDRQGSGMSGVSPVAQSTSVELSTFGAQNTTSAPMTFIGATFAASKRNRSFEDQLGPRVRSGTG